MLKKVFHVVMFVSIFVISATSFAKPPVDIYWSGLSDPNSNVGDWTDTANWFDEVIPALADNAMIGAPEPYTAPIPFSKVAYIGAGVNAACNELHVGAWPADGAGYEDIGVIVDAGGTLEVATYVRNAYWDWSDEGGMSTSIVTISGGTMTVGTDYYTGRFTITGGTLDVGGTLEIGTEDSWSNEGYVLIEGGTVSVADLLIWDGYSYSEDKITVDIREGVIEVAGNEGTTIGEYIADGYIVAYGGDPGYVVGLSYDSGSDTTTVFAQALAADQARAPIPASGSTGIPRVNPDNPSVGPTLRWIEGQGALSHDIYFGTSEEDVTNADNTWPEGEVYKGNQAPADANSYTTEPLEFGQMYYWRIDEVTASEIVKGNIWSFMVSEYESIDDFEDYGDSIELRAVWLATSATINLEDVMTHDGSNGAMEMIYSNTGLPNSSEVSFVHSPAHDYTSGGITSLTISLHGTETLSTGQMYVAIESNSGAQNGVVSFDPNDIGLIQEDREWWRWLPIDLSQFSGQGVDLENVTKLTIGFDGGSGTVYVDDIELHPPMCYGQTGDADINNDCVVDLDDFLIMASDWLDSSTTITATAPTVGPRLWYTFNEGSGFDVGDSSGNGYTGYLSFDSWGGAGSGFDGSNCLYLEYLGTETGVWVEVPVEVATPELGGESTVSLWIKDNGQTEGVTMFQAGSSSAWGGNLQVWVEYSGYFTYACGGYDDTGWHDEVSWGDYGYTNWEHTQGVWNHYAFTKSASAGLIRIYHNGEIAAEWDEATGPAMAELDGVETFFSIAAWRWSGGTGGYYIGYMDDFRVYDYALSQEEVLSLSLEGGVASSPFEQGVISSANVVEDDSVDINDFAVLAAGWITEPLWP